jgi:hypothetical protein
LRLPLEQKEFIALINSPGERDLGIYDSDKQGKLLLVTKGVRAGLSECAFLSQCFIATGLGGVSIDGHSHPAQLYDANPSDEDDDSAKAYWSRLGVPSFIVAIKDEELIMSLFTGEWREYASTHTALAQLQKMGIVCSESVTAVVAQNLTSSPMATKGIPFRLADGVSVGHSASPLKVGCVVGGKGDQRKVPHIQVMYRRRKYVIAKKEEI